MIAPAPAPHICVPRLPTVAGPIYSRYSAVPVTLHFASPYSAPACAPGCILKLNSSGSNSEASLYPAMAGYNSSASPVFLAFDDNKTFSILVLVRPAEILAQLPHPIGLGGTAVMECYAQEHSMSHG